VVDSNRFGTLRFPETLRTRRILNGPSSWLHRRVRLALSHGERSGNGVGRKWCASTTMSTGKSAVR
jgi:hypothetical protein